MQPWSLDRRGIVVLGTRKGIKLGEEGMMMILGGN